MLLTLFVVLMALGMILVFLGYFSGESVYSFIGFSFFFILGLWVLLPGELEVESGQNVSVTNVYDNSSLLVSSSEVHIPTYTYFSDRISHFFGLWLTMLSVAGFAITLLLVRGNVQK